MADIPIPPAGESRLHGARRYWLTTALRHARRTTRRQIGDHPVAIAAALVVAPLAAVGFLALLQPGSVPGAASSVLAGLLAWAVVFVAWFTANLLAAPHRMWREVGTTFEALHGIHARIVVAQAEAILYRARLGLRTEDLGIEIDLLESAVHALFARRPDDLREFDRPVDLEDVTADVGERLIARLEVKRSRLERLVEKVEADFPGARS